MNIQTMTVRPYRWLPRSWAVRWQLRRTRRSLARSKRRHALDLLIVFNTVGWDRFDRRRVADRLRGWRTEPAEAGSSGFCVTFIARRGLRLFDFGYGYDSDGAPLCYAGYLDYGRPTRLYAFSNVLRQVPPIVPHLPAMQPWLNTSAYAQTIGLNASMKAPIVVGAYQPRPLRVRS